MISFPSDIFKPGIFVTVTDPKTDDVMVCFLESISYNLYGISLEVTFNEGLTESLKEEIECANLMKE